jgi:pimeloyl-ACP methyl ester carboxylesterase
MRLPSGRSSWCRPAKASSDSDSTPTVASVRAPKALARPRARSSNDDLPISKLIPPLRAEGHEVITAEYGLDSHRGDVDCTLRALGRVAGPAILVGHSYGGSVITAAGVDDRVAGLVYIAALAPDEDETSQSQQDKFPGTDIFSHIEVADGRIWLLPSGSTPSRGI